MRNIGPKSRALLEELGVHTTEELRRLGVVAVYAAAMQRSADVTRNHLWALEGAASDLDWRQIPAARQQQLEEELRCLLNKRG